MRLMNDNELVITRITPNTGYFDDNERWVEGTTEDSFTIKCSIQPFRDGSKNIYLPEGVKSDSAYFVYTKTKLLQNIEQINQEADRTVIDGFPFECYYVEDWSKSSLKKLRHYKCVFLRVDKK